MHAANSSRVMGAMSASAGGPNSATPCSRTAYQFISHSLPASAMWNGSPGVMIAIGLLLDRNVLSAVTDR